MALQSTGLIKGANDALVAIGQDINFLRDFACDFSGDVADYGSTVAVPVIKATASEFDTTANNFETDSGTLKFHNVALDHHPKATIAVPSSSVFEAPGAPWWGKMKEATAQAVSESISTGVAALFTTSACTGEKIELSTVTMASIAALRTKCAGRVGKTVLALAPVQFATLLGCLDSAVYGGTEAVRAGHIPGLFGFKSVIQLRDLGFAGALIPQDALAIAARGTLKGDEPLVEAETITDENGLPLSVARHFAGSTRQMFVNADLVWGAQIVMGDKVSLVSLING